MAILRAAALTLLVVALVCEASVIRAQAPATGEPQTTAELARAIAFTISRNPGAADASNTLMSLVSATSHGNVVEVRFVIKDAAMFARLKQNTNMLRLGKTSYYCNPSRIKYIDRGIVIHEITASPTGDDQFDYTIDKPSCDALPKPTRADPASLAKLALSVTDAENDALKKENKRVSLFQFSGASAHQGLVEERFTVATNSLLNLQANRIRLKDVTRGYLCGKYRDPLLQGLAIHRMFASEDGSPVFDFTVDASDC
jgi:hypothetical protein